MKEWLYVWHAREPIDIPVHHQLILTVYCYIHHNEHLENPFGHIIKAYLSKSDIPFFLSSAVRTDTHAWYERADGRKWSPKQCILNSLAVMMA